MKTAYVKVPFQFKFEDVPVPKCGSNEALIKVMACGVCGSDMNAARVEAQDWQSFGHEITGVVMETGENVSNVKVGDSVLVESGSYCGTCAQCRNGRPDLCASGTGLSQWKICGFSEYMTLDKQCLIPFDPEKIGYAQGTVIEPMGVALDLFYTTDIKFQDDVAVVGLGPIGLMALRLAKAAGARNVYGVVRNRKNTARIKLAKEFGATDIIYTDETPLEAYPFPAGGVDKIMVTAPPSVIASTFRAANLGAVIAYIGIDYGDRGTISFDANYFHYKKLQLRASYAVPALYFPRCMELIGDGVIDVDKLVTSTFPLEDLEKAMCTLRDDKEKEIKMVMVRPELL